MRIASGGNAELSSVERPLRAELSSVERPLGLGARTERRRVLGLLVLGGSLVLALDRTAWPQDFCRPTESETQEPAQLLAKTANFAVGRIDAFEGGVTDLTFREEGPASQVLATDPVAAENVTSFSADLALKGGLIAPDTTLDVYGIASIPFGLREGASYVIDPGWIFTGTWPPNDGGFFPQLVSTPRIGVMNENGVVLEPFSDVVGLALDERGLPGLILTAMDVHPEGDEIAIVASAESFLGSEQLDQFFLILDASNFSVIRGPFLVKGGPTLNFRSGICYNTCDTVLVGATFRNNFDAHLALEYDRMSGEYTGRAISLDGIASASGAVSAVGLDVGFLDGTEVLYTYNAETDALYALALQYSLYPGVVSGLTCNREPPRGTGPVTLAWTNDVLADYDEIVILQNGVEIDKLPPDASSYGPLDFKATGFNEFAVEIRKSGEPNELRAYCMDLDSTQPVFASGPGFRFIVPSRVPPQALVGLDDPYDSFFAPKLLGLDSTQVINGLEEFRLYLLSTAFDTVEVRDIDMSPVLNELIEIQAGEVDRFTGITLLDVGGETMVALLGRNLENKPAASIYSRDNILFQTIPEISLAGFEGEDDALLAEWDAGEDGSPIAVDFRNGRLLQIEYDPGAGTMVVIAESPLPQCTLGPCDPSLVGGISVLPNGMYLTTGGAPFDDLVTRGFLATPFDTGDNGSVAFTGYTVGLLQLSDFLPPRLFGIGTGPRIALGVTGAHFEYEFDGEMVSEDVTYHTSQGMPLSMFWPSTPIEMIDSFLGRVNGGTADPDFVAEQLFDEVVVGVGGSGARRPIFAGLAPSLDYFYWLVNRADEPVEVAVEVVLGGSVVGEFSETLNIPAGRFVNRSLFGRAEETIDIRIVGTSVAQSQIQLVVGTRGMPEGDVEPRDVFLRGDVDGSGVLDVTDPIVNLTFQFIGGIELVCPDAADFDDSGSVDISDPIANLTFQFVAGGTPPPSPGQITCGPDPTPDSNDVDLGCPAYPKEIACK